MAEIGFVLRTKNIRDDILSLASWVGMDTERARKTGIIIYKEAYILNTDILCKTLGRCKSTVNNYFFSNGYPNDCESRFLIYELFPELEGKVESKRWTVRTYRPPNTGLLTPSTVNYF